MSVNAVIHYVRDNLNGLGWPFGGVPNLAAYIQPPDPDVQSEIPAVYLWPARFRETRDSDRLKAGTVPRAAFPGAPSGTKAVEYQQPAYLVWMGLGQDPNDPDAENVFPGMVETVQAALRGSIPTPSDDGQVLDPAEITDPWTGARSWLIDLGEDMRVEMYFRTLNEQRYIRYDAVIELDIVEVIAA